MGEVKEAWSFQLLDFKNVTVFQQIIKGRGGGGKAVAERIGQSKDS